MGGELEVKSKYMARIGYTADSIHLYMYYHILEIEGGLIIIPECRSLEYIESLDIERGTVKLDKDSFVLRNCETDIDVLDDRKAEIEKQITSSFQLWFKKKSKASSRLEKWGYYV